MYILEAKLLTDFHSSSYGLEEECPEKFCYEHRVHVAIVPVEEEEAFRGSVSGPQG